MRRVPIILAVSGGVCAAAFGQSYNNNLNPLGGPGQLQVNMNPNWAPALGDGRGLERDFSGMGLGNYNRRDFTNEAVSRNRVVSNNVFSRGYYTSSGAYSTNTTRSYATGVRAAPAVTSRAYGGALGADDLFSFRRDSIATAAANLGVRGTESLQYLYGYSTANKFAVPSAIPTNNPNPGAPQSTNVLTSPVVRWEPMAVPNLTVDDFSGLGKGWSDVAPKYGTLRSTSSFLSTRELNPSVIGVRPDTQGIAESLTASPLLGLKTAPARRSDRVDLSQPVNRAVDPVTGKPEAKPAGSPGVTTPEGAPAAEPQKLRTSYDDLLERYAKADGVKPLPGADPNDTTPLWKARLTKLQEQLESMEAKRLTDEAERRGEAAPGPNADKRSTAEQGLIKRREASNALDPETLRLIREAGGEARTYAQLDGHERQLYAKYMDEGSKALAEKRYFDAEEQFVRCLSIAEGDPTVSAARINAQIGAALFLSAALNAKALFDAHPEVIGVRYKEGTIPSAERLTTVVSMLRERVADARKLKEAPPRDAAFLIAYIGYQLGDAAVTREGLDLLDETYADHPDPLVPVIRGVWLEEK